MSQIPNSTKDEEDRPAIVFSGRLAMINSASTVMARLLNVTVLVWMYQHLIARLPTDEFAIYPVIMAVMVFAPLFFSLFQGGLARYVIDAFAKKDLEGVTDIVSAVVPLLAAAVAFFWLIGISFAFVIEHVLVVPVGMVEDARLMMILLVLSFGFQMIVNPFTVGFHVHQRFVELNLLEVGRELLRTLLLLVFLLGLGPSVLWVVIANVIAELSFTATAALRSRQMVPQLRFEWQRFKVARARQLVSFGMWTALGQLGGVMHSNASTIVLNIYGSPVDVTAYFIGATIYRQIEVLMSHAVSVLLPVVTAMHAVGDKARLASTVLRGGRYGLWASLVIAVPAVIYSDIFVILYVGEEFLQAAVVIILFMAIRPFVDAVALLPLTAMATARVREFFLPAFLFLAAGLVVIVLAARVVENPAIVVTAVIAAVSIGSMLIYFWRFCLRLIDVSFASFLRLVIVPGWFPALVGGIAWMGLRLLMDIDTWAELLLCGFLGALVYGAAIVLFGLEPETRTNAMARLRRSLDRRREEA